MVSPARAPSGTRTDGPWRARGTRPREFGHGPVRVVLHPRARREAAADVHHPAAEGGVRGRAVVDRRRREINRRTPKSFLGDDVPALVPSSGEEPAHAITNVPHAVH